MAQGITIPLQPKSISDLLKLSENSLDTQEGSLEALTSIDKSLNSDSKWQKEIEKLRVKEEQERKREVEKQRLLLETLTPPKAIQKMRWKTAKKLYNKIVKGKWLETIKKGMQRLVDSAGNSFIRFLKALFLLALIDPKGTILKSLFGILTNVLKMIIKFALNVLPGVLKTMWNLFWNIIVPEFGKIGKMIGEEIFGKDSVFVKIFEWLGKAAPIVFVILGAFSKLKFILLPLGKLLMGVLGSIAGPFLIIAAAVGLIIYYWDDIVKSFKDDWDKAKKGVKEIGKYIGKFFDYVGNWISAVWTSVKLFFLRIAQKGMELNSKIAKWFSDLWKDIKGFFRDIGKGIVDFFTGIAVWGMELNSKIAKWFSDVWNDIKGFFTNIAIWGMELNSKILKFFKDLPGIIWSGMKKFGKWLWGTITDTVKGFWKFLKKIWNNIKNSISSLGSYLWSSMKKIGNGLLDIMMSPFKKIYSFMEPIIKKIAPIFTTVGNALGKVWDLVSNTILGAFRYIKESFYGIIDWFRAVSKNPIKYFKAKDKEQEKMVRTEALIRKGVEFNEAGGYGTTGQKNIANLARKAREGDDTAYKQLAAMSRTDIDAMVNGFEKAIMKSEIKKQKKEEARSNKIASRAFATSDSNTKKVSGGK